jgi:hypothetical protein
LNFEFSLFLDHGDVIWDTSKGESFGKQKGILTHIILGRVEGFVITCWEKTTYFVLIYNRFYLLFWDFFNKIWDFGYFDSCL